jgi:protein gp37
MAENTKIEWATHTWNPVVGCQKVSPGCDHCYAEAWAKRSGIVQWGPHAGRRRTSAASWKQPHKWNAGHAAFFRKHGYRQRVFCASLADVFDNRWEPQWRSDMWGVIRATPDLDYLLLTKRPQNIARMLPPDWSQGYPNVWLGTTTEDAERYNLRWPILARMPAAVRFISYEPAIARSEALTSASLCPIGSFAVARAAGMRASCIQPGRITSVTNASRSASRTYTNSGGRIGATHSCKSMDCRRPRLRVAILRSMAREGRYLMGGCIAIFRKGLETKLRTGPWQTGA